MTRAFDHMLYQISSEEDESGRGLLTAVVVHKNDNMPGAGFFKLAKSRRRNVGLNVTERDRLWIEETTNVYDVVAETNLVILFIPLPCMDSKG